MQNKFLKEYYIIPILGYTLLSVLTYFVLYQFGYVENLPNSSSLNSSDAGFYLSIKEKGYVYSAEHAGNVGFFPLFSYWWRFTRLGMVGISILNGLTFLTAISFLCKIFKPDKILLGFFMAAPYLFFMWTPFSESIFFLFCTGILYGVFKDNWKIIFVSVLFASLSRATFLFFIPAFVGMGLMSQPIGKILNPEIWKKIFLVYLLPCLLGVSLVVLFQYFQTGKWFAYFEVQTRVWGRSFNFPSFPLGYRTPYWNLQGAHLNFWIAMITASMGLKLLWDWLRQKDILQKVKPYELFSIIFVCMSLVSVTFFNAHWMWNPTPDGSGFMSTHFTGINRYVQPIAFFFILLIYFFRLKKLTLVQYFGIFIFTNLVWLCFDLEFYNHIQRYLAFLIPTLAIVALLFFHAFRWKILGYGIILASVILQGLLFNYFLGHVQLD